MGFITPSSNHIQRGGTQPKWSPCPHEGNAHCWLALAGSEFSLFLSDKKGVTQQELAENRYERGG